MQLKSMACVAVLASTTALASNSSSQVDMEKQVQLLDAQMKTLQAEKNKNDQQMQKLEQQVKQLRAQVSASPAPSKASATKTVNAANNTLVTNTPSAANAANAAAATAYNQGTVPVQYIYAPVVFASPYTSGVHAAYDASDLVTNWPSINEDLAILQQNKKHEDDLTKLGMPFPDRPVISLSGYVEGRVLAQNDWSSSTKSDIDLSGAELDILAAVSKWASAFVALSYDNSSPTTGARYSNSKIYLDRGFATIGNLNEFPVYGTIGQIYDPFL